MYGLAGLAWFLISFGGGTYFSFAIVNAFPDTFIPFGPLMLILVFPAFFIPIYPLILMIANSWKTCIIAVQMLEYEEETGRKIIPPEYREGALRVRGRLKEEKRVDRDISSAFVSHP